MPKPKGLRGDGRGMKPARPQAVQPRLRMIATGTVGQNLGRAELSSSMAVTTRPGAFPATPVPRYEAQQKRAFDRAQLEASLPKDAVAAPMMDLAAVPLDAVQGLAEDIRVSVFVRADDREALDGLVADRVLEPDEVTGSRGELATAAVAPHRISSISADRRVQFMELAEHLRAPLPITSADSEARSEPPQRRRQAAHAAAHGDGKNILIGIIDVGGFDFAHEDFVVGGKTRFVSIWDQGQSTWHPPAPYEYGHEITTEAMKAAMEASASGAGLPATELEPQSSMTPGSHGTHVASIAAGNHGLCPKAKIAAVLVSLGPEDYDRRRSFYDSTRLAHAVDYLLGVARREGVDAVSINISLGTNGHAHDASSATSRWIDSALATSGRAVCVAAGNAGQESASEPGDIGWVMGRIHTSGEVSAAGLARDLEWIVAGNGLVDVSENELELWYSPTDKFEVELFGPGGQHVGPVEIGQYVEDLPVPGEMTVSIYNERYHAANGANLISIYLTPGDSGVAAGRWTVRVRGSQVRDGRFHAWVERDDPRPIGRIGDRQAWVFPSFFSETSMVDHSTVSSLACGQRITSVANLDAGANKVNITSSQGPTRDGRFKPDVAAPGTNIVAARGFDSQKPWMGMTGTSMASPYVCGVVGLMLACEPRLTAAQVNAILHSTSQPLPGSNYEWRNDAGYGVIVPDACIEEALAVFRRERV